MAEKQWNNSFWRTSQVGAYSGILWELGEDQCFIDTPIDTPCEPGLVPHFSVAAREMSDVIASVSFARKWNLYLVIKNTGHEHLGRSSGKGAFSIWTHQLRGREWHDSFVPQGAPKGTDGISAVTLQAGEQWLDVYRDAAEHNVVVVGGSARTVGAAGGWLTGGGHSPFAHFYGLGADNLLEVNLVTASGKHVTLNEFNDPHYFWAVRGGGGSAWGVITSVTYRTHPPPSYVQVGLMQFNLTSKESIRKYLPQCFAALPNITDAGYTGYGSLEGGFSILLFQPNGTSATFDTVFASLYTLSKELNDTGEGTAQIGRFSLPSFIEYSKYFLTDPNIATNVIDTSRLLTDDVLLHRSKQLVDLILDFPDFAAGFNFIGRVDNTRRDDTGVNPAWKHSRGVFSLGTDWDDQASAIEKKEKKLRSLEISRRFSEIMGEGEGTYVNEANPYEPHWQTLFWGAKYERLLSIKQRIDPTNLFVCNRCVGTDIVYEP